MTGTVFYPLGAQIADNIDAHGLTWAAAYYAKRGVPCSVFLMLAVGAGRL